MFCKVSHDFPKISLQSLIIGDLKLFVICTTSSQYVELTGPETLDMVKSDFWKVDKPLELHYLFDLLE